MTIANLPSTTLIDNMISTGGVQTSVNGLTIQNGLTTNLVSSKSATGEEVITIFYLCVCLQSSFVYNSLFTIICLQSFVYNCLIKILCLQSLFTIVGLQSVVYNHCLQLFVYNFLFTLHFFIYRYQKQFWSLQENNMAFPRMLLSIATSTSYTKLILQP